MGEDSAGGERCTAGKRDAGQRTADIRLDGARVVGRDGAGDRCVTVAVDAVDGLRAADLPNRRQRRQRDDPERRRNWQRGQSGRCVGRSRRQLDAHQHRALRKVGLGRHLAIDLLRDECRQRLDVEARGGELVGGDQQILRLRCDQVRFQLRQARHLGECGQHAVVGDLQGCRVAGAHVDLHLAAAGVGAVLRLPYLELGRSLVGAQRMFHAGQGTVVLPVLHQHQDRGLGGISGNRARGSEWIALAAHRGLVSADTRRAGDQGFDLLSLGVRVEER